LDEIKKMIYVSGWHSVLMQQSMNHNKVIVIDQGAIFKMAMLHGFGPPRLKSQSFDKWWNQAFTQWACVLDVVIWLNAPDETLIERIQTRNKEHKLQNSSSQAAWSFLAKYRSSLASVISKLSAHNKLRILNFDTHCQSFTNLKSEVFDELSTYMKDCNPYSFDAFVGH
jgi:deoxyadenosine/deoxycytidine kinase